MSLAIAALIAAVSLFSDAPYVLGVDELEDGVALKEQPASFIKPDMSRPRA